jgi:hypothetical protein
MRKEGIVTISLAVGLLCSTPIVLADWGPAKRLTWTAGNSLCPAIAVYSSNIIHLAWFDNSLGNSEIYYERSVDGGKSWSPVRRLTWTNGNSLGPAIAADSRNAVHVVWTDDTKFYGEIHYKRSKDGGATWGSAKNLSLTSKHSGDVDMAIDSNNWIHVIWEDNTPGNFEIFYTRSKDGGATWSAPKRLTWTPGLSSVPALAIDPSNGIHVLWYDDTPGNLEIFYTRSKDGGATWSAPKRLTWTTGASVDPAIAVDSGNAIHVVWQDNSPGNFETYYRRSKDGGTTWGMAKRLTWTSAQSFGPAVAADSSRIVYIVWYDGTLDNYEIYCQGSPDSGATWFATQRLTWLSGVSSFPDIAVDSLDNVHIVWQDDSPGNYEIYYKKGIK